MERLHPAAQDLVALSVLRDLADSDAVGAQVLQRATRRKKGVAELHQTLGKRDQSPLVVNAENGQQRSTSRRGRPV